MCVHKLIFMFSNNLFAYWRIALLLPHIVRLVIAVERGSGPAVLSLILLKLWSGGSHGRLYHLTGEVLQCWRSRWGLMQGLSMARILHKSRKIALPYVFLFSMNFCVYVCLTIIIITQEMKTVTQRVESRYIIGILKGVLFQIIIWAINHMSTPMWMGLLWWLTNNYHQTQFP